MVSLSSPTHKNVIFCSEYRAAENEWVKAEDERIKEQTAVKLPEWDSPTAVANEAGVSLAKQRLNFPDSFFGPARTHKGQA
jgi:hypothetical protein